MLVLAMQFSRGVIDGAHNRCIASPPGIDARRQKKTEEPLPQSGRDGSRPARPAMIKEQAHYHMTFASQDE